MEIRNSYELCKEADALLSSQGLGIWGMKELEINIFNQNLRIRCRVEPIITTLKEEVEEND